MLIRLTEADKNYILSLHNKGISSREIAKIVLGRKSRKSTVNDFIKKHYQSSEQNYIQSLGKKAPKVLFLDIETAPLLAYVYGLWNNNIPLNMLKSDWFILGFGISWADSEEVKYFDNRNSENIEDDSELLKILWEYLEEADIVIGHNIRKFDMRKIKARMVKHKFKPFSHVKVYDTMSISKRNFGFPSHKLEYISKILLPKDQQKSSHPKFHGFELWSEILKGNIEAWDEMADYCKQDVVANKGIFWEMFKWDNKAPNFEVYTGQPVDMTQWEDIGYYYTTHGKYKKYRHIISGQQRRGKQNLLDKEARKSQLVNIV